MKLQVAGAEAYCHTAGKMPDPSLACVIFLHGAQNDHSVWAQQVRHFAQHGPQQRFNVLAPDLPGHGRSAGPALRTVEAMADWTLALLDAAAIDNALLVGHSMGSLIALEAACRAPARLRLHQIALLGTAFPMKVSDALLAAALDDQAAAIDMVSLWSHSAAANRSALHAPGMSLLNSSRQLMRRMAARNPDRLMHTDFSACNNYAHGEVAARSLRCPALFIIGNADMMTPARGVTGLRAAMPHAQVVTVDAGHAMMQEQPAAINAALLAFARSG